MIMLILGLLIFLGIHCVGFAPEWRQRRVDSMGLLPWKGLYSLIALAGFVLIILGFQRARLDPMVLYTSPAWLGHLNALFTLVAFVLLAAAESCPPVLVVADSPQVIRPSNISKN